MHAENRARSARRAATASGSPALLYPRVVILHGNRQARVKVLELPDSTTVGGNFSHEGTTWRITGLRTSSRVLIAEPEA